jgi:hypothetical protein
MGEGADNYGQMWGTWGVIPGIAEMTTASAAQIAAIPALRLSTLFACMPEGNGW